MNSKLSAAMIAGAVVLTGISPAFAQTAEAPAKAPKARNMNEVVCEKSEVIGSRLATKKVCMTRAQWEEQRRTDRQEVDRAQTMRGTKGE